MVHQYKNNGYNIVMDINSGAIHVVDDVVYDTLLLMDEQMLPEEEVLARYNAKCSEGATDISTSYTEAEIKEAYEEIKELYNAEMLFTEDIYKPVIEDLDKRPIVLKALCLHIAHDCNLACEYCFAGKGEYQGEKAMMSFETGKKALDYMVANSGSRRHLEVDFFGGEPTMNFEVVQQLVDYGRELEKKHDKVFRFTLTTNGLLVDDEMIEYMNKEMSNVVLSLDGRKEINDAKRKKPNGEGSYDVIVPKFQNFVQKRGNKEYYMRGTFTRNNLDFTNDIFHMADLGFKELSMEPVVSKPDTDYALREEDLDKLYEQYEILAKEMIKRKKEGNPFTFYHYMIDLSGGPCIYKRITGCGSGTEYLAVTPNGDLYPCHQFVGDKKFLMGNVWDGVKNTELRDEFKLCNVYSRKECEHCWAKLYCSGGCAANSYHTTGTINGVYEYGCKLFRKRIECAIMVKIAEAMEELEKEENEET